MRTGNVKCDDLHAHEYEQYVKPYEESEGDITKISLKAEVIKTKQAEK